MNVYQQPIESFFKVINELNLRSSHFESVLDQSVKHYDNDFSREIETITLKALIVSDWTGPTEDGWRLAHHSGVVNAIKQQTYHEDAKKMLSFHCCYTFAQAFERLNSLFKDWLLLRAQTDSKLLEYSKRDRLTEEILLLEYTRESLPGGERLFKLISKAAGSSIEKYSNNNNENIDFRLFWMILYEARNAITHSQGLLLCEKVTKTKKMTDLFFKFFPTSAKESGKFEISLTYKNLNRLISVMAEFAIQFFKSLSIQEGLPWAYFIVPRV